MRESHLHGDCGLLQHGPPAQSRARGALSHSCHILKAACSSMFVPHWCHAQVLKITSDLCCRFQQSMSVALQRKFYCKDFLSPGRARVRLFDDNGKPANPAIPNSALRFLSALSFLNGCMPTAPAELRKHDTLDYSMKCTTKLMVQQTRKQQRSCGMPDVQGKCYTRRWPSCAPGTQAGQRRQSGTHRQSSKGLYPALQPRPASKAARVARKSGSDVRMAPLCDSFPSLVRLAYLCQVCCPAAARLKQTYA